PFALSYGGGLPPRRPISRSSSLTSVARAVTSTLVKSVSVVWTNVESGERGLQRVQIVSRAQSCAPSVFSAVGEEEPAQLQRGLFVLWRRGWRRSWPSRR